MFMYLTVVHKSKFIFDDSYITSVLSYLILYDLTAFIHTMVCCITLCFVDPRVLGSLVEMLSTFHSLQLSYPVIVIGTVCETRHLPPQLYAAFLHEVNIKVFFVFLHFLMFSLYYESFNH